MVCDHASNRIPEALHGLGLNPGALRAHIAWDIGAAGVAVELARALDLPVMLAGYSRLVADCNRRPDSAACMPVISDGVLIPGNLALDTAARAARRDELYWPYHHAIEAQLERRAQGGAAPVLVSIHSFTPRMYGLVRPWQIGVLWDRDPRIPLPFMRQLRARGGITVGDNEPYSGRHPADFTVDHHAERFGRPTISIEVRQDLIEDAQGQVYWAGVLAQALAPILADAALYRPLPEGRWPTAHAGPVRTAAGAQLR
ncbi:MAG: N-formylglutamate amidohydrolase [Gammaproteobacteria bacterium]|nr:N-formylglutamate amidohydrolase [Gammaproteobacteria bacterium]